MQEDIFGTSIVSKRAFRSRYASVIGDVIIEEDVIIAPGTSIRADECGPFHISKGTNVQDGVIMHGLLNKFVEVDGKHFSIWIGPHCSIAHRALIHGPTKIGKKTFIGFDAIVHYSSIGRNCFIDFKAVIKNADIGNNCHIGVGAIVINVKIDDGKYVADGQVVNSQSILPNTPQAIKDKDDDFNKEVVDLNKQLVALYRARRKMSA